MTRAIPCFGLITAILCTGCPVRYANTKYEYEVPVAGYFVGGGLATAGTATALMTGFMAMNGDPLPFIVSGSVALGGLATMIVTGIYHVAMESRYEPPVPQAAESWQVAPERWAGCPLGMQGQPGACTGDPRRMTYAQAERACPDGYGLPSRAEMAALLGGCRKAVMKGRRGYCNPCATSSTCQRLFGSVEDLVWTSTGVEDSAWYVNLDDGFLGWRGKGLEAGVVCIQRQVKPVAPE